jgi:hypothetical protein
MDKPIVIAHHLMWTAYGHWLPNDPRGSTSKSIACDLIAKLGELHRGRCKIQPTSAVLKDFQHRASKALKFPLLSFAPCDFSIIAQGLSTTITDNKYTCYACAVLEDHVHILIRKHKYLAEEMIEHFQQSSREQVITQHLRLPDHPVWTTGGWKVFLFHPEEVRRTIHYIRRNPVKMGLPPQRWPFVIEYDGWPLHPGHSANSPYVRGLRNYQP